jgi:hypothetical protein
LEDGIANIQPGNEITVDQSVTTTLPAGAYDFKISGGSGSGGGVCINNGKKTGPGYNSVIPRVISLNNIQLLESANRANYDIVITIGPIARGASSGGGCPYIHLLNFQAHSGNKGADTTLEIPGATINETAKGGCGAEGGKGGSNLNLSQKEDQCSVVNRSKAARGAYVADGKIIEAEDGLSGYVIITRKK